MSKFETLEEMIRQAAAGVRPPERMTVSEATEAYRWINNPGSYVGPWRNDVTPYLVDPMNVLTSPTQTGMVFVGPAQCGKTDMALNWMVHTAICDPADMMLIQTSQTTARDFSIRRLDRLSRHTKPFGEKLIPGRQNDNVFDKRFISGMLLTLSWPTINELSGKPIPRLWLTDYDRMAQNVDGEGSPFDLARKRATSFRSNGMCVAESSPGFEVDNPKWIRQTPHEAPPTQGVLALFNRGDKRRWYWRCSSCDYAFEPDFELLKWPDTKDKMDAAEQAILHCPHCGQVYKHDADEKFGTPGKHEMNRGGKWLAEGQTWTPEGTVVGRGIRSDIASFWLKGVAATFSDWKTLVINYLKAREEYEQTGSQEALKTTVNVDQGNAYVPYGIGSLRLPEELKARAKKHAQREVPPGVRFLIAAIDVQKNRFVVQVHGIGVGGDIWVVDRFDVRKSARLDPDGERFWVNPGAYPEDWMLLIEEVLLKTYKLSDGSGRAMSIKLTLCDSGGEAGVTANAYAFYRFLRDGPDTGMAPHGWVPNLHARFQLVKGSANKAAPRVALSYPDSDRKDRKAGARGEIPVMFVNGTVVKDQLDKMMDRTEPHGGMINFPDWLPDSFYTELTVEVRDPVKGWINPRSFRNESWDLLTYCLAGYISRHIGGEHMDWSQPHRWAEEWDINDLVFDANVATKPFAVEQKARYSRASLAERLA